MKAMIQLIKEAFQSLFKEPYEDEMIKMCIRDYWRLKSDMVFSKDLEELKGFFYEISYFETKFHNAVPPTMLNDHNNDLKRIYQKLIFKFQN